MKPKPKAEPSNLDKIKQANYANCLKKLKAGETLSSSQMKMVEDYQSESDASNEGFLKTKKALAKSCRLGRKALDRYLNLLDAPKEVAGKGWPVDTVKRWILQKTRRSDVGGKMDDAVEDLKKWEIYERARRAHLRNEKEIKTLILRAEHESIISQMSNAVQKVMASLPSRMAVEVVGLTVPEAEIRLRHAVNDCLIALRNYA